MPTEQVQIWQGEFGDAYTQRNVLDFRVRLPAFQEILRDIVPERVLDVGSSRGDSLNALESLFPQAELVGVEPNALALSEGRARGRNCALLAGDVFGLPFREASFDLVMTAAVLIHVTPTDLPAALAELYRVSSRYLLAIEYYAAEEVVVPWRGQDALLYKRDFNLHFRRQFPDLRPLRSDAWDEAGAGGQGAFARCHWWLYEKDQGAKGTGNAL